MVDLADAASTLADGIVTAIPGWVQRCVERVHRAQVGPPPVAVTDAAITAGLAAAEEVGRPLRALLALDIDEQRTTPLAIVRTAVRFPTDVLRAAGVPAVRRNDADVALFPDDPYDLTPANFADLDPDLVDAGIRWGAAKAWTHKERHR